MATNKSAAIGKLIRDTKAPRSIAKPANSSVIMETHAMKCGAGTASSCRIWANVSGPLDSLAKPCSMKPKPTIRRNGIGAHRATGNRPGKSNTMSRKDFLGSAIEIWLNVDFFIIGRLSCPGFDQSPKHHLQGNL